VAADELRLGSDPLLAFRVPSGGDYKLLVSNVSFHGGPAHVYRITLRTIADMPDVASSSILSRLLDRGLISSVAASIIERGNTASDIDVPPVSSAASPGRSKADTVRLDVPARVRGRFGPSAENWFRFAAQKDQSIAIACRAFPTGLSTMPVLALLDNDGKLLAECKSADSTDRECWLDWRATADGDFQIRLQDAWRGARGGAEFGYELTVRPAMPDFSLRLKSDFTNVMQGARSELEVKARRIAGFKDPIDIVATGLPDGVRTELAQIAANQDTCKVVFVADNDARPTDAVIRIIGRATVGSSPVERVAWAPHLGHDIEGTSIGRPEIDQCFLTVQHKPAFRLFCNEAYQYAHRGTIYPYTMQVERLDGFDGEITIQLGDRQNRDLDGVEFIEAKVPAGATEARVPIYLPESMHINVLSQSQIYGQGFALFTDKWGQRQATLVVSEKRNMIRTMPTVVKLTAADKEVCARPGATALCKLVLDRTSNFSGPIEVELVEPLESAGFIASNVRMESGVQTTEIAVQVPAQADRTKSPQLRFRARGQLSPEVAVVSEATIALKIEE
jgi:hypothetical protein